MRFVPLSDGAPEASACKRAGAGATDLGAAQPDPVTRYLAGLKMETSTAYLMETEMELGRRLVLEELEVVYRFESGTLLICHIEARQGPSGLGGAVARLIGLVHAIERAVPEVTEVRGLVPVAGRCQTLNALHRRLLAVYEKQGALREQGGDDADDGSMERVVYRTRGPVAEAREGGVH